MNNPTIEFEFLGFEDDMEPVLVFGVEQNERNPRKFKWKDPSRWKNIVHQTGGYSCHHHFMTGIILTPTDIGKKLINELSEHYLDSNIMCYASMDELQNYRTRLGSYGLDCNLSYPCFEEAIYPIDFSHDALSKICIDVFPDNLDDLLESVGPFDFLSNRWRIWVLGENCD